MRVLRRPRETTGTFGDFMFSLAVFLGLAKARIPVEVVEDGLSIADRIARDFGLLGAIEEDDDDIDVARFMVAAVAPVAEPEVRAEVSSDVLQVAGTHDIKQFTSEAAAEEYFLGDHVVWINTATGVYHEKGSRWYGATRDGAYACRIDCDVAAFTEATPVVRFSSPLGAPERELVGAAR